MLRITTILSFFLILIVSKQSFAQNFSAEEQKEINHYNAILNNKQSHDTSKASAYLYLSEILYIVNFDTLYYLSDKAVKICQKNLAKELSLPVKKEFQRILANSYNTIAFVYDSKGDVKTAILYALRGLNLSKIIGDREGIANALNNLASFYEDQGDILKSLELYQKSLKIREEEGNKEGVANSLNNIGYIYFNQGDTINALKFYQRTLKIYEELNDKPGIAGILLNIGAVSADRKNMTEALNYYNRSLAISTELRDKKGISIILNNIGNIYEVEKQLPKALEYYQKSLLLREELGDKMGMSNVLSNIGGILYKKNNIDEALNYGMRSLKLAQEIGYPKNIKNAAGILYKVYDKLGNYKQALEMRNLEITMRDSINNEVTQNASAQQVAKYQYEKQKAIDDLEHEKQLAIEEKEKNKQKIITYSVTIGLALVVIFLLFVFNRLQVTRKQKSLIEVQKQQVEFAHIELEVKNTEILDSIQYAKRIQNAILPPNKLVKEYLSDSFIYYKPKDIVAGDFYWMEPTSKGVLFAAADCTGHGVPGAMVSVVCNAGLNRSVREFGLTDPAEILNKTREIVIQEFEKSEEDVKDGMDIALCSLEGNVLKYAGANNPLWIIRKGSSEIEEIKANKQPIGKFDDLQPYDTHQLTLNSGDTIYIFSDGYADQFGGKLGKKMKLKGFKDFILSIKDMDLEAQKTAIDTNFVKWSDTYDQLDDVCIIGVRV